MTPENGRHFTDLMSFIKRNIHSSTLTSGVTFAALLMVSVPASASILALDHFEYNTGNLAGQGLNDSYFTGAWTTPNNGAASQVVATSLTYSGLSDQAGGALKIDNVATGGVNPLSRRTFDTPLANASLFVSVLVQFDAGVLDNSDYTFLWLGGAGTSIVTDTALRLGVRGSSTDDFAVTLSNGTSAVTVLPAGSGGIASAPSATFLLVAKLTQTGGAGTGFNRADIWVNPVIDVSTFAGSGQGVATRTTPSFTSLANLGFGNQSGDVGDNVIFDRLIIGETIQDILPFDAPVVIPEATSFAAVGFGVLAVGGWYFRRRTLVTAGAM